MRRHDEMRQQRLIGRAGAGLLPSSAATSRAMRSGPKSRRQIELAAPRGLGPAIGEIDDLAQVLAFDRRVRRLDEAFQIFREPMIAARESAVAVHALLHDHPFAVVGHDEAVQIEIEAVLHRGAVDFGDEPAGRGQRRAVEADALADGDQLLRRLARMRAAAAADVEAEFARERREAAFQRADDAGGDAGGMPVHAHDGAERLEPEGMRQTAQEFVASVMVDDRLRDDRAEPRHALAEPCRHPAVVKRQIGAARPSSHVASRKRIRSQNAPVSACAQGHEP